MMIWHSRFVLDIVFCLCASVATVVILGGPTSAQRPGPPSIGPSLKEETRKTEVRETMLRNPNTGLAAEKVDPKLLEAAIEKVKDDFKRIQIECV